MNSPPIKPSSGSSRRLLPVVDRMILGDVLATLSSVLLVLVTIIVSRKFLNILAKAIEGEIAADTLFTLLLLKTLSASIMLAPPALFLSMLVVFGRMYRDQEMTVLASCGVGPARLYRSVAIVVLPLSILMAYLALQVMPWSERQAQALIKKDEQTADARGIKPGGFNEFSRGDVVLYAESLNAGDNTLNKVFVQSRRGDEAGIVLAEGGYLKESDAGEHFVVLKDGKRYEGIPGRSDFIITEFSEYAVKIDEPGSDNGALKREAAPSMVLYESSNPRERAELQRRLAIPLGIVVLGVLAVPLSRLAPRGGVYGNVLTAFLIFIIYENVQRVSQGMLMTGKIPLWLSYSAAYVLVLLIAAGLLLKANGIVWAWRVLKGRAWA